MSASQHAARLERLRARRANLNANAIVDVASHQAECNRLDAEIAEAEGQSLVGAGFSRDPGETHYIGAPGEPPFQNGWGNIEPKPVAH